jgi:RimJ/RimL family protein N-acetyltransferase
MEFRLRPMEEKDLLVTLEMRNDPDVLKTAITPNVISPHEHAAMFYHNNSLKLIFEVDKHVAGYVQVSRDPDYNTGEWSFHVHKNYKGKGLATVMLGAALYYLVTKEGYKSVLARIKYDNAISKHLHNKLGFKYIDDKDGTFNFEKNLC